MIKDTKFVTAKNLKVGQEIKGWKIGNRRAMSTRIVKEVTPFQVRVAWRVQDEGEWVDASAMFEVELTDKEFYNKYRKDAEEIQVALKNKLLRDQIGYHEMWNAWLSYNIYEMAQYCRKENMKIVGYSEDIRPKHSWAGDLLDIGICAETEDGERFWCHTSRDIFEYLQRSIEWAKEICDE